MAGVGDPPAAQLPLGISLRPGTGFDSYFAGPNSLAIDLLRAMADGAGEQQVFLTGAAGLGRTHLLQAACRACGERGAPAAYLPLVELVPDSLAGLDGLALAALDDVDAVVGDAAWETALFNLINAARVSGTRLALAARRAPGDLEVGLPDLASRLAWGPVVRLAPLDDADKERALAARAADLGLDLPPAVATYLVRHDRRSLDALLARLDELDRASLAAGRRLTVPFVRAFLARRASAQS